VPDHRHLLRLGVAERQRYLRVDHDVEALRLRLPGQPAGLEHLLAREEVLEAGLADAALAVVLTAGPEVALIRQRRRAIDVRASRRRGVERAAHLDGVR